jgi:Ca-activated chloride channel family protein
MQRADPIDGGNKAKRYRGYASRDTISPTGNKDFMARGCSYGIGSSRPSCQDHLSSGFSGHLLSISVHKLVRVLFPVVWILIVCCITSGLSMLGMAQEDSPEVHVTPRIQHDQPKGPAATSDAKEAIKDAKPYTGTEDISLKTHTKPFRKDVDLVLVPVSVTDPMNRLVTGLEKDNFLLSDNGQPQEIRHFSSEDAPISLGVIFDISGSMSNKIDKSRDAVVEFFRTANPQDEFFLITFSERPELLADFTQSIEDIQSRLVYAQPKGRTALLDAIYLGMTRMRKARYEKKALLIISDGGDNHSRYTEGEIKSMVKESDVQIYGIGLYDRDFKTAEEREGPELLNEVTEVTGGRTFAIGSANELADVATKIGIELRNQYVLGYRPTNPARDGKWRKIKVKLNPPKGLPPLHVYAKTGYYAPTD